MEVPRIPNNSLTKEIKELVELCQKLEPEYGKRAFSFAPPTSNVIGDGEFICFSRTTGRIYWEDHGEITDYGDFKSVLNCIMDIM